MRHLTASFRTFATLCLLLAAPSLFADTPPLRSSAHWTQDGTAWRSGAYAYDHAGNIIEIGEDVYRYDRVGRLATATARTSPTSPNAQSFTYDQYGNMRSVTTTTATTTQTWAMAVNPATNQLTGSCPPSVLCFTALYDAAGNHLGRASTSELEWDGIGALRQIRTTRRERYLYDANGERLAIIDRTGDVDGQRRYTLRGADNKVARELTYNPQGAVWKLEKDYVYRGSTLIASFSSTALTPDRHYHVDHLGSTRVVTNGAAFRLATHTYWPFGQTAAGSDIDSERMKFTGHERDGSASDPASQLDYMHARYYDPGASRFLSLDPARNWDAHRAQSWNRYAYALNNPTNRVDRDGRTSYLVSRDGPGTGAHMFIVTHARYPGDPNAIVRSWGNSSAPGRKGRVGRVDDKTTGLSRGTHATDVAVWKSLAKGDAEKLKIDYVAIAATDGKVASVANAVKENKTYHLDGPNSNSVGQAVAERAQGSAVPTPNDYDRPTGIDEKHEIEFDENKIRQDENAGMHRLHVQPQ